MNKHEQIYASTGVLPQYSECGYTHYLAVVHEEDFEGKLYGYPCEQLWGMLHGEGLV